MFIYNQLAKSGEVLMFVCNQVAKSGEILMFVVTRWVNLVRFGCSFVTPGG